MLIEPLRKRRYFTCSVNGSSYKCLCPNCHTGDNCEICSCEKFIITFVPQPEKAKDGFSYNEMKAPSLLRHLADLFGRADLTYPLIAPIEQPTTRNDSDSSEMTTTMSRARSRASPNYEQYKLVNGGGKEDLGLKMLRKKTIQKLRLRTTKKWSMVKC